MFSRTWHRFPVFARFASVTCFPALRVLEVYGFPAHDICYMFSRACICYVFSRAWYRRITSSPTWHWLYVLPRLALPRHLSSLLVADFRISHDLSGWHCINTVIGKIRFETSYSPISTSSLFSACNTMPFGFVISSNPSKSCCGEKNWLEYYCYFLKIFKQIRLNNCSVASGKQGLKA